MFEKESHVAQIAEKYDEYIAKVSGFDFGNNIYVLKKYNVKFYLPFWRTDYIQREFLFGDQYYDNRQLYFATKIFGGGLNLKDKVILDIGANIGNHSIYFLEECKAGKAIAFEAIKETFNILKRNIKINGLESRTELYNRGVGECQSKAAFHEYNLYNIGGTTLYDTIDGDIEICSIDELNSDEEVTLMKVDVEGFEEKLIKGAIKTIEKYRPTIMLEAWKRSETIGNIITLLFELGYEFSLMELENYIFYCK